MILSAFWMTAHIFFSILVSGGHGMLINLVLWLFFAAG